MDDRPHVGRPDYLIRGGAVLSMDPALGTLPAADVLIRGGTIVDIAPELGTHAADAEVIDATDMIVMPGLIDSHFHMWSSLGRNFIADGYEYFPAKWATASLYEPTDFYRSVMLGLVECVNAGITTVHNWSHNTRTPAHADAELRAHRDAMVRARYAYGHRDALPVDEALDFGDVDRVREEWFGRSSPFEDVVHLGVNLRGPDLGTQSVFETEMEQVQARDLPVAIHTVQGGSTAVNAVELESRGYLGPSFLIAHFLAANAGDRDAMARTGASMSYAVHSELRLGEAGDARVALLRTIGAGVNVSFSVDATSIAPVNLFEAMNVAWNMGIPWQGSETADLPALTFAQCLAMATLNGARALGLDAVTGSITPGKRADVILVRRADINTAPAGDIASTVVRSATPANVDTVLIDGRLLKHQGRLMVHDAERIVHEAEDSAVAIRRRAGGRLAP